LNKSYVTSQFITRLAKTGSVRC